MMSAPPIMIQARTGSTRLPGKVLADLDGRPVLEWVIGRCQLSRAGAGVMVLTSALPADDEVGRMASAAGAGLYRGSEEDVLLRFVEAAASVDAAALVRITADCPFVDPDVIDEVIDRYATRPADYVCIEGYPEGVGSVELVRRSALEETAARTTPADRRYREHVISYVLEHPAEFQLDISRAPADRRSPHRFSIDTPADLERARAIARHFHPSTEFRVRDLIAWASSQ